MKSLHLLTFTLLISLTTLTGCQRAMTTDSPNITAEPWGQVDGQPVQRYTLRNANGLTMKVTNYGCIITELHTPDRKGDFADIVLGFNTLDQYLAGHPYFGCIAGRYANRIAGGKLPVGDQTYQLATNNGPNHLHGGDKGFDKRVWNAAPMNTAEGPAVQFTRVSPDGEENYPGRLTVTVTYTLTNDNELKTEMTAETDALTVVNLAQHTYWNLGGHSSGTIRDHVVEINADRYTPVNDTLIPTGQRAEVAGTPFDFREPKPIGKDLLRVDAEPAGYDHNFVINGDAFALRHVATVVDPDSGRKMELRANQPGCQLYTGNFLDGSITGKGGSVYNKHDGFCLETQFHPDSPHNTHWPSPYLKPGETYRHTMITKFTTVK